ncbi:MAG: hypothetical protein IPO94_12495 [Saprospiraceae bacterium]|nr:hypothetical protein [Saprospiraceae bacterium]
MKYILYSLFLIFGYFKWRSLDSGGYLSSVASIETGLCAEAGEKLINTKDI